MLYQIYTQNSFKFENKITFRFYFYRFIDKFDSLKLNLLRLNFFIKFYVKFPYLFMYNLILFFFDI